MPIPRFLARSCAFLLGLAAIASGDTIILKGGEKVEGRITAETDAQVTVQVKVSATINDERIIKRTDIEKIEKVLPDAEPWKLIQPLALGEDSFEPADYQTALQRLNGFVSEFPQSAHAAEAKAKIAQFEEERKRVVAGEVKEKGKWLTKEEVADESVQIKGRIVYGHMRRLAAAGQLSEAMNTFDALEKNFPGSFSVPDAIELARQLVPQIKAAAERQKVALVQQAAENQRRLEIAQGAEREQLATILRNQAAANEAGLAALTTKQPALDAPFPGERKHAQFTREQGRLGSDLPGAAPGGQDAAIHPGHG